MKKNIRKIVMNYMLFDDNFWKEVFKDKKCVEYVLSVILDRKIRLIRCRREYPIRHGGRRSVILDILAEDEEGRFYNLEIQTYSSGASSIRARFNGTRIDGEFSYPGQKWKDMKEIYIIFFCRKDYLKGGKQFYQFDRKDSDDLPLKDGTHVIYINGDMEDDTPIGRLIHDFKCRRWQDMYESPLKERVRFLKTRETEVNRMCEAVERLVNKEKAKERAKVMAEANKTLKIEKAKVEAIANEKLKVEKAKADKRLKAEKVKADKKLNLERAKAEAKAKEEKIQTIKNMIAEGINLETIARVNSMSVQNVQMLLM